MYLAIVSAFIFLLSHGWMYLRLTPWWFEFTKGKGAELSKSDAIEYITAHPAKWQKEISFRQLLERCDEYERNDERRHFFYIVELYPNVFKDDIQNMVLSRFVFSRIEQQIINRTYPAIMCAMI